MEKIIIQGGRRLEGELKIQGSKNSVLPILAATVLTDEPCVLHHCPHLRDVDSAVAILRHLGCRAERQGDTITVEGAVQCSDIPLSLMREMRSSVIFLGAILSRCGQAKMSFPGGCELGPRPVDLHIAGLRKLGAELDDQGGTLEGRAGKLRGCHVQLSFPSVGATENLMLAAAISEGVTTIGNCAKEPEIEDLQGFLCSMGARITGAGSSTIRIEGVPRLHGTEYTVMPDRIVAATYLSCVASAGGHALLTQVCPRHLESVTELLEESGCALRKEANRIAIWRKGPLRSLRMVRTMPYPGFPTDAQSILMACMATANGTSVFVENIFENRYKQVGELSMMGADIRVNGRTAVVTGVEHLHGACVECTDLRGGASLAVAALAAQGQTEITKISHIQRGYDDLEGCLRGLGADVRRQG